MTSPWRGGGGPFSKKGAPRKLKNFDPPTKNNDSTALEINVPGAHPSYDSAGIDLEKDIQVCLPWK